jgi:hypothetical protein
MVGTPGKKTSTKPGHLHVDIELRSSFGRYKELRSAMAMAQDSLDKFGPLFFLHPPQFTP